MHAECSSLLFSISAKRHSVKSHSAKWRSAKQSSAKQHSANFFSTAYCDQEKYEQNMSLLFFLGALSSVPLKWFQYDLNISSRGLLKVDKKYYPCSSLDLLALPLNNKIKIHYQSEFNVPLYEGPKGWWRTRKQKYSKI